MNNPRAVIDELERIEVDRGAHGIFVDKSSPLIVKFDGLSTAQAHVFKQLALICGADLAIPRNAYYGGRNKKFPALLFANRRSMKKIIRRMAEQPWMEPVKSGLARVLGDHREVILRIGNRRLNFDRTYLMGVINLTPDSFYSGSRYSKDGMVDKVVEEMVDEGADFIDIGAESTRPGAEMIDEDEEIGRLRPILSRVVKISRVPISVDTCKAKVASFAVDQGAKIINDISGLGFDKQMPKVVARHKVAVVIMHIKGRPKIMQRRPVYHDLMEEIYNYLSARIDIAVQSGIAPERIIVDPGLGFGKRLEDNYEIIKRMGEFRSLGRPIMAGHSRKSFIGNPFDLAPENRLEGSLGVEALLIKNGVSILRVHDVLEAKRVAMLIDRIER